MPLVVGRGQNIGLRDFCNISKLLPPGASVFHKHMSSFYLLPSNTTTTCKSTETQHLYSCCCCLSIFFFVCLFLIFILFLYLNCLICFKFYSFISFIIIIIIIIIILLNNFLGTLDLFPSLQLGWQKSEIRACAICHQFECTWDEGSSYCDHALSVVVNFSHCRLLLRTEFNETWHEARSHRPLPSCWVFFSWLIRKKKQDGGPGRSVKKVTHCIQVHNIWPFGSLILSWIYLSCLTLYIGK